MRTVQTEAALLEANRRHLDIALGMLAKVKRRIESFNENKLTAMEVRVWCETGVNLERLARGMTTSRDEQQVKGPNELILRIIPVGGEPPDVLAGVKQSQHRPN